MKKPNRAWKVAVPAFASLPTFDLLYRLSHADFVPAHLAVSLLALFASIGSIQFAFGVPRLPKLFWRIVGPVLACLVAWLAAWPVGWLATRLAIRPLTGTEQLWTLATLLLIAAYGLVVVLPLYWLGEWQVRSSQGDLLRESNRALSLWFVMSAFVGVLPILPFYWFWQQISASPGKLVLISSALLWVMWSWWKFADGVADRIRILGETSEAANL